MSLLPSPADADQYFAELYRRPLAFWQPALSAIAARHGLPDGPWERAALGRNVVFLGPAAVLKLGPPCWPGDMAREAQALALVAGRLPARTPAPLASGALGGWEYLITDRCDGINLYTIWQQLPPAARAELAAQHGRLMAAIHALPAAELPASLRFDWAQMQGGQRADAEASLVRSGLDAGLVRQALSYVAAADALAPAVERDALVHGDLTHLNFLVEQRGGRWLLTGLLDWGDVKVGPWTHELISPAVHMYLGDSEALAAWYAGYGRIGPDERAAVAQVATARALLYYADEFASILGRIPGGERCRDWHAVARCLWQLDGGPRGG